MAYYARYEPDETGALQKVVYNCGVGFCLPFYGEVAPPGTLACDGSEISREAYKELFQVLGTKAGAGDGVSTFNLPDFRGDFIRCVGGNAAVLGVEQKDATAVNGMYPLIQRALVNRGGNMPTVNNGDNYIPFNANGDAPLYEIISGRNESGNSCLKSSDTETRPVNIALLWCIIYE